MNHPFRDQNACFIQRVSPRLNVFVNTVNERPIQIKKDGWHVTLGLRHVAPILKSLDAGEKRKPQTGNMKVSLDGQKREIQILTAGSTAGEQLRATVDPKKRHQQKLEELGMPEDQMDMIRAAIGEGSGVVEGHPGRHRPDSLGPAGHVDR